MDLTKYFSYISLPSISNCALATCFGDTAAHVFDFVCETYWRHVSPCRLAQYVSHDIKYVGGRIHETSG